MKLLLGPCLALELLELFEASCLTHPVYALFQHPNFIPWIATYIWMGYIDTPNDFAIAWRICDTILDDWFQHQAPAN